MALIGRFYPKTGQLRKGDNVIMQAPIHTDPPISLLRSDPHPSDGSHMFTVYFVALWFRAGKRIYSILFSVTSVLSVVISH